MMNDDFNKEACDIKHKTIEDRHEEIENKISKLDGRFYAALIAVFLGSISALGALIMYILNKLGGK
jgi:hypothetical protein